MEPKVVYRILRKLSEWAIDSWYSEVHVEGVQCVPKTGPIIVAATHHNEMFDIATLTVTIPHGRPVCFWAKSTMFNHPIAKFIMESSGAIRVRRNPNRAPIDDNNESSSSDTANGASSQDTRTDLFQDTTRALAKGEAVGVFPEGTSYTLPAIAQVLPGTAWAAVEYVKSAREERFSKMTEREKLYARIKPEVTGLEIVPVGIVYENKRKYLSRVYVTYGAPVEVDEFTKDLFFGKLEPEEAEKVAKKRINDELERRLRELTINAPDWDTLYAARTAVKILWGGEENVQMESFVDVNQNLVAMFSGPEPDVRLQQVRISLTRYYSLLYYTGIDHAILEDVLPLASTALAGNNLSLSLLSQVASGMLVGLPFALLRFVLFLPTFIFHIPAYLVSYITYKSFYTPGEEETEAQYRAFGGGIGLGFSILLWLTVLWMRGTLQNWNFIGVSILIYASVFVLVKWHSFLVKGNLRQIRRYVIFGKLLLGVMIPGRLRADTLQAYCRPPPPPVNIFIKKHEDGADNITATHPPPIPASRLVRELLTARFHAYINLGNYLRHMDSKELTYILSQGARVPSVVS